MVAKDKGYTFESIGTYDVPEFSYKLNLDGQTLNITGYNRWLTDEVEIPSELDGKKVTVIGYGAFNGSRILKNIVIPDSVTNIDDSVFSGCSRDLCRK